MDCVRFLWKSIKRAASGSPECPSSSSREDIRACHAQRLIRGVRSTGGNVRAEGSMRRDSSAGTKHAGGKWRDGCGCAGQRWLDARSARPATVGCSGESRGATPLWASEARRSYPHEARGTRARGPSCAARQRRADPRGARASAKRAACETRRGARASRADSTRARHTGGETKARSAYYLQPASWSVARLRSRRRVGPEGYASSRAKRDRRDWFGDKFRRAG